MPVTLDQIQPFIDPASIPTPNTLGGYIPNLPTTGGNTTPNNATFNGFVGGPGSNRNISQRYPGADPTSPETIMGGPASFALGDLFGGLFGGGGGPTWRPYMSNGLYYANDPRHTNPIPITNIPGAPLGEGRVYQRSAAQIKTINDLLPYLTQAINQQSLPTALNDFNTSAVTSPLYANLMTQLFNTYGPALNQIGNTIQRQNALSQAETERQVMQGPGSDLVRGAYDLSQVFDQPWFQSRDLTASKIKDLMNSIDLTGSLSDTERSEIEKSLARQGVQRGTQNAPSNTDTVANAMRFGQAGYQRKQQAISNLSDAISKASAFLPNAKSGVDVFQVATGRSSMPNPGQNLFPGINQGNNSNAYGLAGSLLGTTNSQITNQMQIDSQKKDWLDKFNQITSGVGNLMSSAKGAMGLFGL